VPTKIEKDVVTGQETTAHQWDGLRELNTPLPKWWIYTFYATVAWALVWFVLYPSVPWVNGYFHGVRLFAARGGEPGRAGGDGAACRDDGPDRRAVVR
jgi:cytochrome c oxidase cbb3-type subunit III